VAGFSRQARQRIELQRRIAAWTDVPLTVLALVLLGVLTGQLLLRLYALGVSGYVTAVIAVRLFGAGQDESGRELAALRTEIEAVRRALEAQAAQPTLAAQPTPTPTLRPTVVTSNGAAWPAAPRR
jgi:hypothetical protein